MLESGGDFCRYPRLFKLKACAAYACYVLANVLFVFAAVLISLVLAGAPKRRERALSRLLRLLLRAFILRAFPAAGCYAIEPIGGLESVRDSGAVYVANHTSLFDPLLLLALIPNACCLLKSKYESLLAAWFLTRYFNFVSVDASSSASVAAAEERLVSLVRGGTNVIVFPEGRRSATGRMGEFKRLAFKVAASTGADVVPVAIRYKFRFLGRGDSLFFPRPGNVFAARFLPPMPSARRRAADLSDEAFRAISSALRAKKFDSGGDSFRQF